MRLQLFPIILAFSTAIATAREWRSLDGKRTFQGSHLSNDGEFVTMRNGSQILTFSIDKLHPDDQTWIAENHPVNSTTTPTTTSNDGGTSSTTSTPSTPAPKGAAFDTLEFGDTRTTVTEKLSASNLVTSDIEEVMRARVGLNGTFYTKETVGGLHCYLYFGWNDSSLLDEVTLRTKEQPSSSYNSALKNNWQELAQLLSLIHGKPLQASNYPNKNELQDGLILGSHLWRTEAGHSVLLGTGQTGTEYSVIVRITTDKIATNPTE